ncbi:sulfotransferase [Ectothiorhodospiraceae bacterium BW-2]|nr:sulfotransferase [Ectothiorhodospiraceae bacterium BW-2]
MSPPVIIVGMHRSGTSVLTQLLAQQGIFWGVNQDHHFEPRFFQQLNDALLSQTGGRWDWPEQASQLWCEPQLKAQAVTYLNQLWHALAAWRYWGVGYGLSGRRPRYWGWKDPRTTLLLPLWLQLFPDAKIIHLQRHGVDVAHSLLRRNQQVTGQLRAASYRSVWRRTVRRLRWWLPQPCQNRFTESYRCLTLEGGLSLWSHYMAQAEQFEPLVPAEQWLNLRFESLCEQPVNELQRCFEFIGIEVSRLKLQQLATQLRPELAGQYRRHSHLQQFAEQQQIALQRFNY